MLMKKMAKQLFAAAVAFAALTACSDSNFNEVEAGAPAFNGSQQAMNTAVLTDANNQKVSSVSSNFGTYYLDIKTDGVWYIEPSNNMEFTATKTYGKGSARIPVLIGNNWAEARQLSYKVNFVNEGSSMRRAGESNTQTVIQESSTDLANFSKIIDSNKFVGYGYNFTKHKTPELCTGQPVFNMEALNGDSSLVKNGYSPHAEEDYFYAHSQEVLDKVVAVNGHPGGNFGAVKLKLDLDNVNVTRKTNFEMTVMQKSLTRTFYSRELIWTKALLKNGAFSDANFSEGFKYYKKRFIEQCKAVNGDTAILKKGAAKEFFDVIGTHFVNKAMLGCALDYRMAVAATKASKATDVKAALDFKWKQQVKDTAKVDSAQLDSLKKLLPDSVRKNFVFQGGVAVKDSTFSAASSTFAQCKSRGNEVGKITILTNGGTLNSADLAEWMLSYSPEKAVMTEMVVQPIYRLFDDSTNADPDEKVAYKCLKDIIDKEYSLEPAQDGFGKLKE